MIVDGVYEHINNGGVTFKVNMQDGRPVIEIKAIHFTNITNSIYLNVTPESLLNLGNMFIEASNANYIEGGFYNETESFIIDKESGKTKQKYEHVTVSGEADIESDE